MTYERTIERAKRGDRFRTQASNPLTLFMGLIAAQSFVTEEHIFVDVGAHVGFATFQVAAMGRAVVAFEPLPLNARHMCQGIAFNAFWRNILLVRSAVGNRDPNARYDKLV